MLGLATKSCYSDGAQLPRRSIACAYALSEMRVRWAGCVSTQDRRWRGPGTVSWSHNLLRRNPRIQHLAAGCAGEAWPVRSGLHAPS